MRAKAWPSVPLAPVIRIGARALRRARQHVVARPAHGVRPGRCHQPGRSSTGWSKRLAAAERLRRLGEQRRARLLPSACRRRRLVASVAPSEQRAPVDRAEQRPERDRANVGAPRALASRPQSHTSLSQRTCSSRVQPWCTSVTAIGIAVTLPGLAQPLAGADLVRRLRDCAPPRRRRRCRARWSRGSMLRIAIDAVVEVALAGEIMVDADDVGRCRAAREPSSCVSLDAALLRSQL